MTVISDKLSNSQTHETLTCSSGNERMFYDDAGFLSAWATPQVLVSNFILKTFGGLSLWHSDSETRRVRHEEEEDKLMCHLARAARNQHLIPGTAHLTRRQSFVWHAIMTLWLVWHFLLFTVTHDTCDVKWRDVIYVLMTPSLRGNVIAHLSSTKHFNKNSSAPELLSDISGIIFSVSRHKIRVDKKFSEHSSVWQWRNVVKYCSAQYWFYVFYAAFCRVFVKITDI